jgi:SH3-like domain-containing protein|tara:strand:- start:904 stop:1473 length:570 start_codon:yes stop_codon:yes gene_type:complete
MRNFLRLLSAVLAFALLLAGPQGTARSQSAGSAVATNPATTPQRQVDSPGRTGRPLPRFAALRAGEVNLRTGPGIRYPIDWVIKRKSFPVEIIDEFGNWRRIRDWQGTSGWVHASMLMGRRTARVLDTEQLLLSRAQADAPPVARLAEGALGVIKKCQGDWCLLEFDQIDGYLRRRQFYGSYPNEAFEE